MKAVIIDPEGTNSYRIASLEEPSAGLGEALLEMRAATLNFRDFIVRSNPVGPYCGDARGRIAGSDGVGVVTTIGDKVSGIDVGGRYMPSFFPQWLSGNPTLEQIGLHLGGSVSGVLAEVVSASAASLVAVPDHLDDQEAAALPCAGVTAWTALARYGRAKAGETVLLQGTGGVSIFGLQIAKAMGLKIIVTSSSDEKLVRAKNMGADVVINYRTTPDWAAAAVAATGGRGVDHVIDVGGEATMSQSLSVIAPGGHVSLVGVLSGFGGGIDSAHLRGRILHLHTIFVESREALQELSDFVALHRIRPVIDRQYALEEANEAVAAMISGQHFGKIAIRMAH